MLDDILKKILLHQCHFLPRSTSVAWFDLRYRSISIIEINELCLFVRATFLPEFKYASSYFINCDAPICAKEFYMGSQHVLFYVT